MKLLIVDDEPLIREGIKKLINFEALGIDEVYEAVNGEQAFDIFMAQQPEIILADINMPRVSGLEFAEKVKDINRGTKLAMITGYDYFDYAQKALRIGVEDYILKPVSRDDITKLLHKLTEAVRAEAGEREASTLVQRYKEAYQVPDEDGYSHLIKETMTANGDDPSFSLTVLAEALGLSTGYTSGLFKKLFQISFKEALTNQRLDKARIFLLSTEMKLYEISESVGFNDPNYFSTAFKKKYGISPGKYREKARIGQ